MLFYVIIIILTFLNIFVERYLKLNVYLYTEKSSGNYQNPVTKVYIIIFQRPKLGAIRCLALILLSSSAWRYVSFNDYILYCLVWCLIFFFYLSFNNICKFQRGGGGGICHDAKRYYNIGDPWFVFFFFLLRLTLVHYYNIQCVTKQMYRERTFKKSTATVTDVSVFAIIT